MRKNLFTFALLGSAAALPMQSIAKQKTEQNKKDKLPNVIVILADEWHPIHKWTCNRSNQYSLTLFSAHRRICMATQ